jgi:hypothetical protein
MRVAKQNYSYEKRQREIAKKKKKEEKRMKKAGIDESQSDDSQFTSTHDDKELESAIHIKKIE